MGSMEEDPGGIQLLTDRQERIKINVDVPQSFWLQWDKTVLVLSVTSAVIFMSNRYIHICNITTKTFTTREMSKLLMLKAHFFIFTIKEKCVFKNIFEPNQSRKNMNSFVAAGTQS